MMDGEISVNKPTRAMADAKETNETDHTLREFKKCVVALRDVLDQDRPLDDMAVLFIENHIHTLQMAYIRWKRKHRPLSCED
jgi:hypothetical protein